MTTPQAPQTSTPVGSDTLGSEPTASEKSAGFFSKLYTGTGAFDVIGRRRFYYALTAVIVLIAIASIAIRWFDFSIEFEGGSQVQFPVTGVVDTTRAGEVFTNAAGYAPQSVQIAGSGSSQTYQISAQQLDTAQVSQVRAALFEAFQPAGRDGVPNAGSISFADVSSTWGDQITNKALIALAVFLVLVTLYIAFRFREKEMAIAALATLFFDVAVTAGAYSLVGFEVTPATVIGLLTILGFSIYDTVVVFDKVEENVRGVLHTTRRTYGEQANLAVNQTLMRSINTTLISVLPILALLVIAVWFLGVGTLKDLALIQLVGIVVGAYSSIFFATPLLVSMKERTEPIRRHTAKVLARRERKAPLAAEGESLEDELARSSTRAAKRRAADDVATPAARPQGKRSRRSL